MHDNVYQEYKRTIHYSNHRTGVRATCPDCHVPGLDAQDDPQDQASQICTARSWGTIDTRESSSPPSDLARTRVAAHEGQRFARMPQLPQSRRHERRRAEAARPQTAETPKNNATCIDCHKGIAHHKPQGMTEDDEDRRFAVRGPNR